MKKSMHRLKMLAKNGHKAVKMNYLYLILVALLLSCGEEDNDKVQPDDETVVTEPTAEVLKDNEVKVTVEIPQGKEKTDYVVVNEVGKTLKLSEDNKVIGEANKMLGLINKNTGDLVYIGRIRQSSGSASGRASGSSRSNTVDAESTSRYLLEMALYKKMLSQTNISLPFETFIDWGMAETMMDQMPKKDYDALIATIKSEGDGALSAGLGAVMSGMDEALSFFTKGLFGDCFSALGKAITGERKKDLVFPQQDKEASVLFYNISNVLQPYVQSDLTSKSPAGVIIKDVAQNSKTGGWDVTVDVYNGYAQSRGITVATRQGKLKTADIETYVEGTSSYGINLLKNAITCEGFVQNISDAAAGFGTANSISHNDFKRKGGVVVHLDNEYSQIAFVGNGNGHVLAYNAMLAVGGVLKVFDKAVSLDEGFTKGILSQVEKFLGTKEVRALVASGQFTWNKAYGAAMAFVKKNLDDFMGDFAKHLVSSQLKAQFKNYKSGTSGLLVKGFKVGLDAWSFMQFTDEGSSSVSKQNYFVPFYIPNSEVLTPTLTSPINGEEVEKNKVIMSWKAPKLRMVETDMGYKIYLSTDGGKSYEHVGGAKNRTSVNISDKLPDGIGWKTLYWKIQTFYTPKDLKKATTIAFIYSAVGEFVVKGDPIYLPLPLLSPATESEVTNDTQGVTLSWSAVDGVDEYELFLGSAATGGLRSQGKVTGTSKTLTELVGDATYYWNVEGLSGTGSDQQVIARSGTWSFALGAEETTDPPPGGVTDAVTGLTWVTVTGGTYMMGCKSGRDDINNHSCDSDEKPLHSVTVGSFKMSAYEVTNAQYAKFLNAIGVGSNGTYSKGGGYENKEYIDISSSYCKISYSDSRFVVESGYEHHPVVEVSWYGARNYCKWVGGRLPSEEEWEYAARGGASSKGYQFAGSNDIDQVAWYDGNSGNKTHVVGGKMANELGLYDMSGNVWEWCESGYGSYSANPSDRSSSDRVMRGGSWYGGARYARVSDRFINYPTNTGSNLGFRPVLSL